MYQEDTIAAIATAPGEGGVAIVRVSGADAEKIACEFFPAEEWRIKSDRTPLPWANPRPQGEQPVDEVLLTIMRNPRSYTGEDVVEIHCHGGSVLSSDKFSDSCLAQGARQAEPR